MAITSDIRIQLLGEDDSTVLSNQYVNLMLEDAMVAAGITDRTSIALRYYTCYLIAVNWESIGAVRKREGVEYAAPNPQKYLDLYNDQLRLALEPEGFGAWKEATNEGNIIGDEGVMEKGDYDEY